MQPSGQAVWHPSTNRAVLTPAQPQGISSSCCHVHPGTGHCIGAQSAGRVVCVTVGQAGLTEELVGLLGIVVMMNVNDVVDELLELATVVVG